MQENFTLLYIYNNCETQECQLIQPDDLHIDVRDYIPEMPEIEVPEYLCEKLLQEIYS